MKNVLIIGGSSDIGIALAKYLKINGFNTIVTYCHKQIMLDEIETIKCDVCLEDDIDKAIKYVIDKYGKIDILINMAAISLDDDFLNKSKEEFMHVLEVNLVGAFLTSKIYTKYVSDGKIINIASTDGVDTFSKYNVDYAASKAGLITLTRNLALCTSNKVIGIAPNWIDSETTRKIDQVYLMDELKRIGQNRLITIDEFTQVVGEIINKDVFSGTIFRIDIEGDKLWTTEI